MSERPDTPRHCGALPCGDHGACTCYGDNLMRVGAENERKRIVEWLREEADTWTFPDEPIDHNSHAYGGRLACLEAAGEIERGKHMEAIDE